MIGPIIRTVAALGKGFIKVTTGAAKFGSRVAATTAPFIALGSLSSLLNKNKEAEDDIKKSEQESVQESVQGSGEERPIPKTELVFSDISPPVFKDHGRVDIDYSSWEKDLDLEQVLRPLIIRVDLIDVKIKRINRFITALHNRLLEIQDTDRQDKLAERRWKQEQDVESAKKKKPLLTSAVDKIGDVAKGLLGRLMQFAPLAGLGLAAAGLSFMKDSQESQAAGEQFDIEEGVKNILTRYEDIEAASMQFVGANIGRKLGQKLAPTGFTSPIRDRIRTGAEPLINAGRGVGSSVAGTYRSTVSAAQSFTSRIPGVAGAGRTVQRFQTAFPAFAAKIQSFASRATQYKDDAIKWIKRLPSRFANLLLRGIRYVAKWGLIVTLVGNMGWNTFLYQTGQIEESEFHERNKTTLKEIVRLFGGPMLLGFVFGLAGTVIPIAGNLLGAAAGIIAGIMYGDDVYNLLNLDELVDGMYDWIESDFKDTSGLKAWATKPAKFVSDTLVKLFKEKVTDIAESFSFTDTPMSEERLQEKYEGVSLAGILVQARTGGIAATNDEDAIMGVMAQIRTPEQWENLQRDFNEKTGQSIEQYLGSFLSTREYDAAMAIKDDNISRYRAETGTTVLNTQGELLEYAIDTRLYIKKGRRSASEIDKDKINSFADNPDITTMHKISVLQSIVNDDDISAGDKTFINNIINRTSTTNNTVQIVPIPSVSLTDDTSSADSDTSSAVNVVPSLTSIEAPEEYINAAADSDTSSAVNVVPSLTSIEGPEEYTVSLIRPLLARENQLYQERATGDENQLEEIRLRESIREEVLKEYTENIINAAADNVNVNTNEITDIYKTYVENNISGIANQEISLVSKAEDKNLSSYIVLPINNTPMMPTSSFYGSSEQTGSVTSAPPRHTYDSFISNGNVT